MNSTGPEEIWRGDLFDRETEAALIVGYVESIYARPSQREDKRAHTIAVDGGYGEGKSFFLRRLAKQMASRHPVAYVDAWVDDLADEPLTALAATLKDALSPFTADVDVQSRFATFVDKSGKVAKIAAMGLLKQGVSMAVGGLAVQAIGNVVASLDDDVAEAVKDNAKDAGSGTVAGAVEAISKVSGQRLMAQRIETFEAGKRAVSEMKESLAGIVQTLPKGEMDAPIIIIIDELDRCRPTYAVKLLEEIKHLFDVSGIVFILGMNSDQLATSVAGAYGPGFNGWSYLRRLINREYRLAEVDLERLVDAEMALSSIDNSKLVAPRVSGAGRGVAQAPPHQLIAMFMKMYGFKARDVFEVIDILQTAQAVVPYASIQIDYFVPLLLGRMRNMPRGQFPNIVSDPTWTFAVGNFNDLKEVHPHRNAEHFQQAVGMENSTLNVAANGGTANRPQRLVWETRHAERGSAQPLPAIDNYPRLLELVGRFTNPSMEAR